MKGSGKTDMTINIGGEFLKLTVPFEDQGKVREVEATVSQYCSRLRKEWPYSNDRQILAMAAYEFARWHRELQKNQEIAMEIALSDTQKIDSQLGGEKVVED